MNDLDKLRELKQLDTIIQMSLQKTFSNELLKEWVDDIEKVGLSIEEYYNIIYKTVNGIIDKYKDDFSSDTHYKVIEFSNNDRDYFNDELESEMKSSIFEKFKEKYNVDDEFCVNESDWLIGDGFLSNLLYYFRLFYEKWYLQSKINNEIDNLFKIE